MTPTPTPEEIADKIDKETWDYDMQQHNPITLRASIARAIAEARKAPPGCVVDEEGRVITGQWRSTGKFVPGVSKSYFPYRWFLPEDEYERFADYIGPLAPASEGGEREG